ncbi:MAG: ParB/RepB/Spo0J family partition protein, partial [Novosphingobium sp.]|nr:ParB/RepB/Spo0J family partition protein [Novosphingobium sp.]
LLPQQLEIDAQYQRSVDSEQSQQLVRAIAQHWNWDLCQPLVVARRPDGKLYVIDGQHRLAAARLRGDIPQLPAVVVQYDSVEDEAASFVLLNQQRKPLSKLDLFKAAVASGDTTASAIVQAMDAAGIRLAPHQNYISWKPGMVSNIGGIEACWKGRGALVTRLALKALAEGFEGQVLRYAGTIFPGIAAVIELEVRSAGNSAPDGEIWDLIVEMLAGTSQEEWRRAVMAVRVAEPSLNFAKAAERALLNAWSELLDEFFGEELPEVPWNSKGPDGANDDAAADDDPDDDPDAGNLETELAQPWEDAAAGDVAEVFAADPAEVQVVERKSFAPAPKPTPKPVPAPSAPKTPPKIDWGKISEAAKGLRPVAVPRTRSFRPDPNGKDWCEQCDARVTRGKVNACRDKHCSFGRQA